ncbi:MAG: hypothetical protein GYA59_13545 [Chloroflexi bacterium]|nr:hypothetical protein [Chloroflexota bacterium]
MNLSHPPLLRRLARTLRWTRASTYLMSAFIALLFLIGYIWWPLVVEYLATYDPQVSFWRQFDWLLLGNFLAMSLLIMANADLRRDWPVVAVGLAGGLVIESWGTQTQLWTYYTQERPPLWIIPAWPIASLSIDRLYRLLRRLTRRLPQGVFTALHWLILPAFYGLLLFFVRNTFHQSLTRMALLLCAFLILTNRDRRAVVLTFIAGSGLGYFLERWGTTRQCWTYYTLQTPPLFAVLAHGMAAVAFWRVVELYRIFRPRLRTAVFARFPALRGGWPTLSGSLPVGEEGEGE